MHSACKSLVTKKASFFVVATRFLILKLAVIDLKMTSCENKSAQLIANQRAILRQSQSFLANQR